jgi:alkylation response protein AidB-like acyl-CoA dehydrogenase
MDLDFGPAEEDFRAEMRAWLRDHVPAEPLPSLETEEGFAAHREWERTLGADRLAAVSWPEEYGGRGVTPLQWLVFEEEYYAAGAPGRVNQNGTDLLATTLLRHGTPEQLARILPPIAAGEVIWAQAWSEPGAGSDLAGLRSTATRADDGKPAFAELFLDGVFVPDHDVIGTAGEGWKAAMSTAGNERGLALRPPGRFMATVARLAELWRERADPSDTALRDRLADAWIRSQAYRLKGFETISREDDIGVEASVTKVFWSELDVALHETALDLLGPDGELASPWLEGYVFSLAGTIYAGTNEIQRNVIAERLLGLPRGAR